MVGIEHFLCSVQVQIVYSIFVPWQSHHSLQVCKLHAVFRTLRVQHIQFVKFFVERVGNILAPRLVFSLVNQLFLFRRAFARTEFLLNVLYLLLQEVFPLLLVNVFSCLGAYVAFQFQQLAFAVQNLEHSEYAFFHGVLS